MFTPEGWEGYQHWVVTDRKILQRLNELIRDTKRSPFQGIGKPEPLRDNLHGWWSRRITEEHRLVYRVTGRPPNQVIEISACRLHYR